MNTYVRAMIASFVATVVLSILMLVKSMMGVMPQLDLVHMLSDMAHAYLGIEAGLWFGWIMHFMIGTVLWGLLYALLHRHLPGTSALAKGVTFGALAWLLMMLVPMPMAGAGLFGMKLGLMAPMMTLVLHLIWGAVLGATYAGLGRSVASA